MKDLDFDELDRAVNSLLGSTAKTPNTVVQAPLAEPDVSVPHEESVVVRAVQAEPAVVIPARPLAARRSSGRFMDVVHPSSDMRSPTNAINISPISHSGMAIQPSEVAPMTSEPVVVAASPSPSALTSPTAPVGDWPDPIDFQSFDPTKISLSSEPSTEPEAETTAIGEDDTDIDQITDDINASLGDDTIAPLESPFLTDAKVEKRPLGAFSTETPTPVISLEEIEVTQPEPVALLDSFPKEDNKGDDTPQETDTPLPAELQNDLLSIESNETVVAPDDVFTRPSAPSTDVPISPVSINQQYTEQPSTGDKPVGAIFDSDAYKKPLAHPKKKKSGWLVVLWIILLLIVGAGIGAALYFFVLPKL